jgi:diguanylate cyclase (GGDEF)-like protein/PAS domain S-box-containing protein
MILQSEILPVFYTALNFITTLLLLLLCVFVSRKKGIGNALIFVLLLLSAGLLTFVNGCMIVSKSTVIASVFENIRWFSLALIPPLLLTFILDITGRIQQLSKSWMLFFLLIPITTQVVVWTNDFHHLMIRDGYQDFLTVGSLLVPGERVFGFWFWIHSIWGYFLVLMALYILVQDKFSNPYLEWQQFTWLFVGFFIPILFSVIDTLKLSRPEWFMFLPFGFVIMGISFFIAISKDQFINLIPIARSYLIDTLPSIVILVNRNLLIADINPAGCSILGKTRQELVGKKTKDVLSYWPMLERVFQREGELSTSFVITKDIKDKWYDTHITPLRIRRRKIDGWIIILHDITKLKETEVRATQLAAVIEQAHETVVITDLDANITYTNPYFEVATGYSSPEVMGKNMNILQSGVQDSTFYEGLWRTIGDGEAWSNIFINKRKDGSLFHEAATIFPIKNSEGDIINYAAVKRDITLQVKSELSLRQFNQKLEKLHEITLHLSRTKSFDELLKSAAKLGHEELDFDRIRIWFVDATQPELLLGSFGIDENGKLYDERKQQIEIEADSIYEFLRTRSRRVYYKENQPIFNCNRELIGSGDIAASALWDGEKIIGYIRTDNLTTRKSITINQRELLALFTQTVGNLATRKRIEAKIQDSERRYRLLANHVQDVIWTIDLQGMFTYVSPSVERLLGFTPDEILSQNIKAIFTPESYQIAYTAFKSAIDSGKSGKESSISPYFELEQLCKKGSTVWTEVIITVISDDHDGIPLGVLGVTRDITERKKTEKSLQTYANQQALLNKITQAAIQQTGTDEILQIFADRMGELLEADGCYITLWDEKTRMVQPAAAFGPLRDEYKTSIQPQPGEATLTESVLKHEDVLIIEDVFKTPYVSQRIAAKFPTRSSLALPLIADRKKLGAVLIAYNHIRKFKQSEVNISKQAAQQIALAILKTKLLEEAEKRATEAETLRFASAMIAGTLEQDKAIERILEELNRVVPYDSASVLLNRGREMEIVGVRGFRNQDQVLGLRFDLEKDTPNNIVYETHKPYILENAPEKYPVFRNFPYDHIHGWMGIPLLVHDKLIGMLSLDSTKPNQFTQNHARLASAFAGQVAIALENARLFEETRRLAITDSLTNLFNRRHFMELARREFDRCNRYKTPLSIIMLDLDRFKIVNDTFGHLTGDQVLQTVANLCKENLRSIDIMGRYGGEEFVILLPETPLSRPTDSFVDTDKLDPLPAQIVAERLRETFEREVLVINGNTILITISLGIAEYSIGDISIENVINHADQALLRAKQEGRNRVITWFPEENFE